MNENILNVRGYNCKIKINKTTQKRKFYVYRKQYVIRLRTKYICMTDTEHYMGRTSGQFICYGLRLGREWWCIWAWTEESV